MSSPKHKELASGNWQKLSLIEQLGNIGSEIGRTRKWQNVNEELYRGAYQRTLELFDLTINDPRWKHRLKEITRARSLFCATLIGRNKYKTELADLERHFFQYALAARRQV